MKRPPKERDGQAEEHSQNHSEEPLRYWSVDTDPAILSDDRWVDEHNDIGHTAVENKEMERGIMPGARFMHPMHDASYRKD